MLEKHICVKPGQGTSVFDWLQDNEISFVHMNTVVDAKSGRACPYVYVRFNCEELYTAYLLKFG